MKNVYKLTILLVFLFVLSGISMAQSTLSVASLTKDNTTATWHLFKTQGAAKIYYQYVDCGPIEFINFKVENTSSQSISVQWNFVFTLNGVAFPTNPDDVNITINVGPGASESGVCFSAQNPKLNVFLREANQSFRLDAIQINNLLITN